MSRWVSQTKFGGPDAPRDEMGDCLQSCIASILGIPLEEAFDANLYSDSTTTHHEWQLDEHWYLAFEKWAAERGLSLFWLQQPLEGVIGIGDVHSVNLGHGIRHAVVVRGKSVIWDPQPQYRAAGVEHEFVEETPCFMYLVPGDFTEWARRGVEEGRS